MVHQVTSVQEFQDVLSKNPSVVVDFFAEWCGPCKAIAPALDAFSNTYSNVAFIKVDVDNESMDSVVSKYGVQAMPTFLLFKNGQKVSEVVGANKAKLEESIKNISN